MKNIFKIMPIVALAMACTSCNDLIDDKAAIDAKYHIELPTLTLQSATAVDYSTVSVSYTISDIKGLANVGVQVATTSDFANPEYIEIEPETTGTALAAGLAPDTKYYVRLYAYTPDNCTFSESKEIVTPKVPLTASLLEGKTYKATAADYWEDPAQFAVSFVADKEDPYKVVVCNLLPYLVSKGATADKDCNMFEGVLDPETGIITFAAEQPTGYNGTILLAFDTDDPATAENYDDVRIQLNNYGASITILNAFGAYSPGGWYDLYLGGITLKP